MHRNLTVYEVLYYQAMLRLPSETKKATIELKIKEVHLFTIKENYSFHFFTDKHQNDKSTSVIKFHCSALSIQLK